MEGIGKIGQGEGYKLIVQGLWILTIILIELMVPFACVLLLPLLLFNFPVRFIGQKINSKLGPKITGLGAMAASDDIYRKPLYSVLLHYFVDGAIDLEEHRTMFQTKIIDAHDENGRKRYPELQKYITTFCDYSFWHQDINFSVKNHIKLIDKESLNLKKEREFELNEDDVMTVMNDILIRPFEEGRSPWEILIVHGAKSKICNAPRQSLVLFRYHHAMCDGYSITKLMSNVTTGEYFTSPFLNQSTPLWRSILEVTLFPFMAIFAILVYFKKYIDQNVWTFAVDLKGPSKIRDMTYVVSDPVPINKIKDVKKRVGASFNDIILQGITGGIRNYFLQHGPPPKPMHVALSFPVPGHPNRLTNHWTAIYVSLPLDVWSPHRRLQLLRRQFKTFEMKFMTKLPFLGTLFTGHLSNKIIQLILNHLLKGSTITMSIFPGPENLQLLTGENIVSGGFLLGPMNSQGVCITVVSCNGALRVFFGIEKSLINCETDAKEIVQNITQEFSNI